MEDLNEEIEKIFSDCTMENEASRVKSSIVIEAIAVRYCLDEGVKNLLVNKLDPDNIDNLYSKDELFVIFKDWITSNGYCNDGALSPISYNRFKPSLSVSTPDHQTKTYLPLVKLFLDDETIYLDSDVDCESNQNSNSSKILSIDNRRFFRSIIHKNEILADSLEKKYESVKFVCENQKIEIERLRKKLINMEELKQCLEEQRLKDKHEFQSKFAKSQELLDSLYTEIDCLEKKETDHKRDLSEAHENSRKWENNYLNIKQALQIEEIEVKQKNETIKQLESEVADLNIINENNNIAISKLMDENVTLNNRLNDEQQSCFTDVTPDRSGVALCEELPSDMLLFPQQNYLSNKESLNKMPQLFDQIIIHNKIEDTNKNYYRSQESQTNCVEIERFNSNKQTQTTTFKISNYKLFTDSYNQTCKVETREKGVQVFPSRKIMFSQTTDKLFTTREAQTELHGVCKKDVNRFNTYLIKSVKIIGGTVTGIITLFTIIYLVFISVYYGCNKYRCFEFRQFGPPPV